MIRSLGNFVLVFVVSISFGTIGPIVFSAYADSHSEAALATLYSLEGTAEVQQHNPQGVALAWAPCSQGQTFNRQDEIRVGANSRAGIQFSDGLFIRLSSKSSLRFSEVPGNNQGALFLNSGKAHFFNRQAQGTLPAIETSVVSAAVRGTEFVVEVVGDTSTISVIEGAVQASNKFGTLLTNAGEQAITTRGSAPRKAILISAPDAVQWTAEVPVIFNWANYGSDVNPALRATIEQRNYSQALSKLGAKGASLAQGDLLLTVGQISEAESSFLAWKKSNPHANSQAIAHANSNLALIALAKNDLNTAKRLSNEALQAETNNISAQTALSASYIAQYEKDLPHARDILRAAVKNHPDVALLHARLAELELGFGETDLAHHEIKEALRIDSQDPYALTVLGFIKLFEKDTIRAKKLFKDASTRSGSGLPFLGLGLAQIYEGDLRGGQIQIARAVLLEPARAVFRSYLGKAFFELEKEDKALREYDEAIRLDPYDPTAWLYRGFSKLSSNNLVGALNDVEQSYALNNDRAVIRSSFMLDEDLAVKSAGLSRIYTELGFNERARIEAVSSLSKDATNFSAHRLLADSQQEIFFADASFSESRIADLLAPLSFNLFSTLGGSASLNEYDALFDKSERRRTLAFSYDQRSDLFSLESSYSGKTDVLGYSMLASAAMNDGSKHKNWGRDYRVAGALRYQMAPDSRLLFDARGTYNKVLDDTSDPQEINFERGSAGLAHSYQLNSHSTILSEITIGRDVSRSQSFDSLRPADSTQIFNGISDTVSEDLFIDPRLREYVTAVRGGNQWMYNDQDFAAVAGWQGIHQTARRSERSLITDDELGELAGQDIELTSFSDNGLSAADIYLYPTWHATSTIDLTAGLVRTDLEAEAREIAPFGDAKTHAGRWNPKFGLTATPFKNATLRAAYFESLRKSSLEDQVSIEPTTIGGITQRFNDLSGTESRNAGFGADYKFVESGTYIGGEYIRRHLAEPATAAATEIVTDIDNREQYAVINLADRYTNHVEQDFARGYIYQVLSPSLVSSFDYRYGTDEVTDHDFGSDFLLHRASAQLKYFHSSGMFTFARATWRKQQGINDALLEDGKEVAWVFDAGLGYRLPNRRGIITLEILNLANEKFNFDQSRGFENFIKPDLTVRLNAAINF